MFEVPGAHPTSVGLIKYILKRDDLMRLTRVGSFKSVIVGTYINRSSDACAVRTANTQSQFMNDVLVDEKWSDDTGKVSNNRYRLEGTFAYRAPCGAGDCGSVLSLTDSPFESRVLCGMHVAGDKEHGFSTLMCQEDIQYLVDTGFPNAQIFVDEEESDMIEPIGTIVAQGLMPSYGIVKPNFVPQGPYKSEHIRSVLSGKLPEPFTKVTQFPAKLKPFTDPEGNIIDPMAKALKNYEKYSVHFPEGLIKRAVSSYEALVNEHMNISRELRSRIPLKEALHKFRNVNGISSGTSAGWPMALPISVDLKKKYFHSIYLGNLEEAECYYTQIQAECLSVLELLDKKIRPFFAYKDFPKDETRPLEKVLSGSTRLVSGSPFIYLCLVRQMFGAFMDAFISANLEVGSAVGVNPYSRDWDRLARKLQTFCDSQTSVKIGAGDYSKFDATEYPEVLWEILNMINRWYGVNHPDNHYRTALWTEITNSKHIFAGELKEWNTGMPSGNPLTTIINCIYNHVAFRMCYIIKGFPADTFNNNVVLFVLGDDNTFSVSSKIEEHFNEMTLVELMEKIGMNYTTELKQEATVPFRKITEVEFLKRSFRFDKAHNRWVAPLNMESIMCRLNWTKKGLSYKQVTADELSGVFSELSLHGKETFYKYSEPLLELKRIYLKDVMPAKGITLDYDVVYSDTLQDEVIY
jgi:hypothetical protein